MSINIYDGLDTDVLHSNDRHNWKKGDYICRMVEVSTVNDFIAYKNHMSLLDLPQKYRQVDDALKEIMNFKDVPLGRHVLTLDGEDNDIPTKVDGTQTILDILENLVVHNTNKQYRVLTEVNYKMFDAHMRHIGSRLKYGDTGGLNLLTQGTVHKDKIKQELFKFNEKREGFSYHFSEYFSAHQTYREWQNDDSESESDKYGRNARIDIYCGIAEYLLSRVNPRSDTGFSYDDLRTPIPLSITSNADNGGRIWIYKADDMNIPLATINTSGHGSTKIKIKGFSEYKSRQKYTLYDNGREFDLNHQHRWFQATTNAVTFNKRMKSILLKHYNHEDNMQGIAKKMDKYYLKNLLKQYVQQVDDLKVEMITNDQTIPLAVDDLVKEYGHMVESGYTPASPKLQEILEVYKSRNAEYVEVKNYSTPLLLVTKLTPFGIGTDNEVDQYRVCYYNEMTLSKAVPCDAEKIEMLTQDKMDESVLGKMAVLDFDFSEDDYREKKSSDIKHNRNGGFKFDGSCIKSKVGVKVSENRWWIFTK